MPDENARGGPPDGAGRRSPDTSRALDPRARILAATVELIGETGWGRVTTRKVAERADVNNALLHYYFGTKQALLVQAATEVLVGELGAPIEALMRADDLETGLAEVVAWFDQEVRAGTQARVLAEITVQALHDPALKAVAARMLRELRAALADAVRRAGPPDADAEGVAQVLAALLDGLLFHRLIDPSLDLGRSVEALRPILRRYPT